MMDEATQDKRISQLYTRGRHDQSFIVNKISFEKTEEKSAKILIKCSFLRIHQIKHSLRISQDNLCQENTNFYNGLLNMQPNYPNTICDLLQEKRPSTFAFPTAFRCFQLSLTAFQKFDTKISY